MPTRCNRGFHCRSYCLLNSFRAPLCPPSGAQEYYTVIVACGIWCRSYCLLNMFRAPLCPSSGAQELLPVVFGADLIACSTCFGHHYAHHSPCICNMLNDHCHRVSTHLQSINIIIIIIIIFRSSRVIYISYCLWYLQHQIPQAATTV